MWPPSGSRYIALPIHLEPLPHKPPTHKCHNQPTDPLRPEREVDDATCFNKSFHKTGKGASAQHQQAVADGITEQQRDAI